jgi:hypothetical protein
LLGNITSFQVEKSSRDKVKKAYATWRASNPIPTSGAAKSDYNDHEEHFVENGLQLFPDWFPAWVQHFKTHATAWPVNIPFNSIQGVPPLVAKKRKDKSNVVVSLGERYWILKTLI